jgi:hypothetical protein
VLPATVVIRPWASAKEGASAANVASKMDSNQRGRHRLNPYLPMVRCSLRDGSLDSAKEGKRFRDSIELLNRDGNRVAGSAQVRQHDCDG